jgi:hypothetical protein
MSYIGQTLPADTFQGFTTDSFTGDGSATTFTFIKDSLLMKISTNRCYQQRYTKTNN